jgi:hypothetical protein
MLGLKRIGKFWLWRSRSGWRAWVALHVDLMTHRCDLTTLHSRAPLGVQVLPDISSLKYAQSSEVQLAR